MNDTTTTPVYVLYVESVSAGELSDEEAVDRISDVMTDTVYSNLANLLTALQSARPLSHTLDSSTVNNSNSSYSAVSVSHTYC